MIIPVTPYCPHDQGSPRGKDLGYAYREVMGRLRADDVAVFMDHDITFLTPHWYPIIEEAVLRNPGAGVFVAVQHSDDCARHQRSEGSPPHVASLEEHSQWAAAVAERHRAEVSDITGYAHRGSLVGFLMAIPKRAWEDAGLGLEEVWAGRDVAMDNWPVINHAALPGTKAICWNDGFIGRRLAGAGYRAYALPGLYVYHHKMQWTERKNERDYHAEVMSA